MFSSAQRTHRGYKRKYNEDTILTHPDCSLFVVADGMGGHSAGDLASQFITNELQKLQLSDDDLQISIEQIEATLADANEKIYSGHLFNNSDFNNKDSNNKETVAGSTVVIVYIVDDMCCCLWVGDSRLYIFRNNKLYQITKDHSLVQDMIDSGQLTYEQAKSHPKANVITRAIGADKNLKIDINQFEIHSGDKLLLCSDGLYNEISSDVIISSLQKKNTDHIANKLLGEVLLGDASDNISMIVIEKH